VLAELMAQVGEGLDRVESAHGVLGESTPARIVSDEAVLAFPDDLEPAVVEFVDKLGFAVTTAARALSRRRDMTAPAGHRH
jgi:hypothetical protein